MKLADLRKLSIRQQIRIHFPIGEGLECVVTEHGVAQVPGLHTTPHFNLEQELASASDFMLEPVGANNPADRKSAPKTRQVGRSELAAMTASPGSAAAAPEHEEE